MRNDAEGSKAERESNVLLSFAQWSLASLLSFLKSSGPIGHDQNDFAVYAPSGLQAVSKAPLTRSPTPRRAPIARYASPARANNAPINQQTTQNHHPKVNKPTLRQKKRIQSSKIAGEEGKTHPSSGTSTGRPHSITGPHRLSSTSYPSLLSWPAILKVNRDH